MLAVSHFSKIPVVESAWDDVTFNRGAKRDSKNSGKIPKIATFSYERFLKIIDRRRNSVAPSDAKDKIELHFFNRFFLYCFS